MKNVLKKVLCREYSLVCFAVLNHEFFEFFLVFFELVFEVLDGFAVVLEVEEFAAFRAFEFEFGALVEAEAYAVVAAHEVLSGGFAVQAVFDAVDFSFEVVDDEVLDLAFVEAPVMDVPSFFLVFFALEADEVEVVELVEVVAYDVDFEAEFVGELELAHV